VSTGAQYVVAAYAVVLGALLLYVVVVGMRLARLGRQAELLARLVEEEPEEAREAQAAALREELEVPPR
jgi:hypothetical protein